MIDFQEIKNFYGLTVIEKLPKYNCTCIYMDMVFYEVNKNEDCLYFNGDILNSEPYENTFKNLSNDILEENNITIIIYKHNENEMNLFNCCFGVGGYESFLISEDFFSEFIDGNVGGINFGYCPYLLTNYYWIRPNNKFRRCSQSKDINVLFNVIFFMFNRDFNNQPKRRYVKNFLNGVHV